MSPAPTQPSSDATTRLIRRIERLSITASSNWYDQLHRRPNHGTDVAGHPRVDTLPAMVRVCFVCTGNICRSPTAEGVMRHLLEREGLTAAIEIDSAATGPWHIGEQADDRARAAGTRRGFRIDSVARQVTPADFARFDYLVAMDRSHVRDLERIAPD